MGGRTDLGFVCAIYVVIFGLRYQIHWDNTGVVMRASGGPDRRIDFNQITKIEYEKASAAEFNSQSRPYRRLVIHGRRNTPDAFIDISLRHFRPDDIGRLLRTIHQHRPELILPTVRPN